MRVADVDEAGAPVNRYSGQAPVSAGEPDVPYAVHLARAGRYYLLAFDLDDKQGPVDQDLAQLCLWLDEVAIPYLVTRSGGGGCHVWVAIAGGVPAITVAQLARAMSMRLPTLDTAPLTNPATGAVRPPGARHRTGHPSRIVQGEWSVLTDPVASADHVELLLAHVGPASAAAPPAGRSTTSVDAAGHRYLAGPRRELPPASRRALSTPLACGDDHSQAAWVVLIGVARARQHHQDAAALRDSGHPGLEGLRSAREPGQSGQGGQSGPAGRRRLSAAEQEELLTRQWARAVAWVADAGAAASESDATYPLRLQAVLQAVIVLQARAEASRGRWARSGGRADRRVLDQLCVAALSAVTTEVDYDIRSLAIATGLSRETARYALTRLAEDHWIRCVLPGIGTDAATWSIAQTSNQATTHASKTTQPGLSTEDTSQGRSHVVPPPTEPPLPSNPSTASALPARRAAWIHRLTIKLSLQAHDAFVAARWGGLGHETGALYAALTMSGPCDLMQLALLTGMSTGHLETTLRTLAAHRLARVDRAGMWRAGSQRHRTATARQLGTHGVLAARKRAIALDRTVWAWWQAESDWMHTSARDRPERARLGRGRRPGPGQLTLATPVGDARRRHGPYPRHPGRGGASGRADHTAARAQLAAQAQRTTAAAVTPA